MSTSADSAPLIETDVLVVGGGGAGLACAETAASHRAPTMLIEKNPQLGGTTWLSIGSITATNTSFQKKRGSATGQGGLILAGHGHHLGSAFTSGRRVGKLLAAVSAPRQKL